MVDDEGACLDDVRLAQHRPAQERSDAREELEVEVARDDVVGTALERAHTGDRIRVRVGQDDHGNVPVPAAPRLARPEPSAELGLADDDDVGGMPLGEVERASRPRCAEDGEAVLAELPLEVLPRGGLVLGQENRVRRHPERR